MKEKIQQIITTFSGAVVSVMGTMAQVQATPGKPFTKKAGPATGDISGIIGMSNSNGLGKGSMSLTFTSSSALGIVGKMVGENVTELNQDVVDAVGEITNMVCGQGRKGMADHGVVYSGAIPSVVTGPGHTIKHVSTASVLAIPFGTEFGPITIEICFG
ncbi:chemotaxis protein CheX [Desulfoplanes sp.]